LAALQAALGRLSEQERPLVVTVSAGSILHKAFNLPSAARRSLKQALIFALGRETPFDPSELFWAFAIRRQDMAGNRIIVDLAMMPRAAIADLQAVVHSASGAVAAVEGEVGGQRYRMVTTGERAGAGERPRQQLRALAAMSGALALAGLLLPLYWQGQRLTEINQRMADLQAATAAVAVLQENINQLSQAGRLLADEHSRVADPLAVLAATTQAIPDDSFLAGLDLSANRLTLIGYSPSAAELIGRLAAVAAFREPAFTAPVVHPPGGKLEFFSIGLAVGSVAEEAPP
jgi:general secretion pathway protein L